ncbi:MAG: hypothetical protein ACOZQL_19910 [Myxococcota bacterium]
MFRALLLAFVLPLTAHAQPIVVAVLDANGVSDATVKRLQRATEAALKQTSSLTIGEGPAWKKGAPRKCTDDCARSLVESLDGAHAVLLELKGVDAKGERVAVELQLWLDGERLASKRGEGSVDGFEGGLRTQLETLLPAWARKGFGGLRVEVESGSVAKVDGRLPSSKPGDVIAVPAGVHQVDVVFPEGHAVLQRVEVTEGARVRVEALSPSTAVNGKAAKGMTALRGVGYGVFVAGAATMAGGLVAGTLGRHTAGDLTAPCKGDVRDCTTLDVVLTKQAQAQAYADTGNVMLGVGAGLAATGALLFLIDALTD